MSCKPHHHLEALTKAQQVDKLLKTQNLACKFKFLQSFAMQNVPSRALADSKTLLRIVIP